MLLDIFFLLVVRISWDRRSCEEKRGRDELEMAGKEPICQTNELREGKKKKE